MNLGEFRELFYPKEPDFSYKKGILLTSIIRVPENSVIMFLIDNPKLSNDDKLKVIWVCQDPDTTYWSNNKYYLEELKRRTNNKIRTMSVSLYNIPSIDYDYKLVSLHNIITSLKKFNEFEVRILNRSICLTKRHLIRYSQQVRDTIHDYDQKKFAEFFNRFETAVSILNDETLSFLRTIYPLPCAARRLKYSDVKRTAHLLKDKEKYFNVKLRYPYNDQLLSYHETLSGLITNLIHQENINIKIQSRAAQLTIKRKSSHVKLGFCRTDIYEYIRYLLAIDKFDDVIAKLSAYKLRII